LKTVLLQAAIEQAPEEIEQEESEKPKKLSQSVILKLGRGFAELGRKIVSSVTVSEDANSIDECDVFLTVRDNHFQSAMEQFSDSKSESLAHLYT